VILPASDTAAPVVSVVLEAFTDQALQLMFRPGSGPPGDKGPGGPFHAIVVEVENVVRDGIARGELRDVGDVRLAVELLSGVMRAGAERIGRDPGSLAATVRTAQEIILASLVGDAAR
jgi:hypothetical protein